MRVLGIAVSVSRGRPTTSLVVLDDSGGSPSVEASEQIPANAVDLALQLHDTAEAVRSRLRALQVDRVVVRRADHAPVPSNKPGPRFRLLMEGAVTAAARSVVVDTRIGTGQNTGAWYGSTKAAVEAAARNLGLPAKFTEATAAALAGLALP